MGNEADAGESGGVSEKKVKGPAEPGQTEAFKDFAKTTSSLVQQAASILEEEIAAGIVAAKQVEGRFVNINELRSGKPEEVMQRFRGDAVEFVNILIDLLIAASRSMGVFTRRVIRIRADGRAHPNQGGSESIPSLAIPQAIRAGQSAEIPMTVENDSDAPTAEFSFLSGDLINASGERIPASRITFSPPSISVPPHNAEKITVAVSVPEGTHPGEYLGVLQAPHLEQLRAVLSVCVE